MKMHCDRLRSTFGWRGFSLLAAILMGSAALVSAKPTVSARGGNIYIVNDAGVEMQLTSSGHDSNPVLDPAGQWVVFVRETSKKAVSSGAGDHPAAELWQVRADPPRKSAHHGALPFGKDPARFPRHRKAAPASIER